MSFRNKTGTALKNLLESQGADGAQMTLQNLLESKKIDPEDFSLKELWEQCNFYEHKRIVDISEAITTSSFPKITGTLINAKLIEGYDSVDTIGDQLVTVNKSNVQKETVAGLTSAEGPMEVGEGQDYSDSTFKEKYVTADNTKFGRMISITEEMIYFDKTGQVMIRARDIGEKAALYKEQMIVEGVQDVNSNVYQPSGTPAAFYSAAHGNYITSNPFGEAGLDELFEYAHNMKDDSQGFDTDSYIHIDLNNMIVLVPVQLINPAWQMNVTQKVPEGMENAENYYKGKFRPLTSQYITQQSSTTWYAGNFKKNFWWNEVWPLQTMVQAPGHEDQFKKDIKMRVKTRFYGSIMAVDYKHAFKCAA